MLPLHRLDAVEAARIAALDLSYPGGAVPPPGYWSYTVSAAIGHGRPDFERAAAQLLAWEVFRRSGISVAASSPTAHLGAVAQVGIPVAFMRFRGYSRVVEVIEEPDRRGVGYGTVPGHPQSGREDMVLEIEPDGRVRLTVSAFSRPLAWYARLARPLTRFLQRRMARRFLRALLT